MRLYPILVVGIGNRYRCDDAAGLEALTHLRQVSALPADLLEWEGELTALIERWEGYQQVILLDAVEAELPPGTVVRHEWRGEASGLQMKANWRSSHAVGVVEVFALAQALGRLPERVVLYGVVGQCFQQGVGLCMQVAQGVSEVVRYVVQEIMEAYARVCDC